MKFVRIASVLALAVSAASVVPVDAAVAPSWRPAKIITLPPGATGLPQGYLPALSCPSAGNCVAAGAYSDAAGKTQGLLLNEVAGVWKSPTSLKPPKNAASNPAVTVLAVSCGSRGNCDAVGSYQDQSGNARGLIANKVGGVWKGASESALPANAHATSQNAQLHSVACASPGNCSAVGTYLDNATPLPRTLGYVLSEVKGAWRGPLQVTLPAGANANPLVTLGQVACASPGDCSAVGSYIDANNVTHALIVSEAAGTWSPGVSLLLPGNASAYPTASLSAITCSRGASCTAIGSYEDSRGNYEGLAVTETNAKWGRAIEMRMPASAGANPHVFFYGYGGVSCRTKGNCSAGGQYRDASGDYQGFLVSEVNGVWQSATKLKLPASAQQAGKNGGVVAVSCASPGNCSTGAAYVDASGNYQALVANQVAGQWQIGTKVTLPPGATTVGVDGGVYGVVCQKSGACVATGSFLSGATNYQGFTIATG
jgi:hypothetical protein